MKTESWINIEEFMNDLFGRDSVFTEDAFICIETNWIDKRALEKKIYKVLEKYKNV